MKTNGTTSASGYTDALEVTHNINPLGMMVTEQTPFNLAQQSNPALVQDYDNNQAKERLSLSNQLKRQQEVYDQAQGEGRSKAIQKAQPISDGTITKNIPDKQRKGNRGSYLYNELLNGLGSMAAGLGDVAIQAGTGLATNGAIIESPDLTEYRRETAPSIRNFLTKNVGSELDPKLKRRYQDETFTAALGGLANSAPAMAATVASGGLGGTAMFLQSYDNALQSIDQTEEGKNLDNTTKTIFATSVGTVVSALEKYGLDKIFKGESGAIANLITKQAVKQAARESGGKVTGDVLSKFLDREVINLSSKYLKGGIKALDGALVEYGTEALQEGAQAGGELLLNAKTGKSVFDTTETSKWSGFLGRMNKAGVLGAIGGGFLGSIASVANINRNQVENNEAKLQEVNTALENENLSESTRQLLTQSKIQVQNELEQDANKIDKTFNDLAPEQKEKVLDITDRKVKIAESLKDEAIPESVKNDLVQEDKDLDKELEAINPEASKKEGTELTPVKKGKLEGENFTTPDGKTLRFDIMDGINGKVNGVDDIKNKNRFSLSVKDTSIDWEPMVASVSFWKDTDGKFFSNLTDVTEKYRNLGLATAMYDFARKNGIDIKSSKIQTELGNGFANKYFNENKKITNTPVKKSSDVLIGDEIFLDGGKKGEVSEIDGNLIKINLERGGVLSANPALVEMTVRRSKEAVQETISTEPTTNTTQAKQIAVDPLEGVIDVSVEKEANDNVIPKEEIETKTISNEVKQPLPTQENVVTETVSPERNQEVLTKAEDDLKALKQVANKVLKHEASLKRLTEAKNKGEITQNEFDGLKKRFDEVLGESAPTIRAENLSDEETKQFEQEFKNEELTHHDFIEHENRQQTGTTEEAIQQPSNDAGTSGQENTGSERVEEEPKPKGTFQELVHKNIQSEEVSNTLNNIERETGRTLDDAEKEYQTTKRLEAINHGKEVVDEAKIEFGDDYANKLLNYLEDNKTVSVENRSLITISLELDLERRILAEPENAVKLEKQLKLVRDISTKNQRSAAIATGYGILRQLARVGYDISQVTNELFSSSERAARKKLNNTIQSDADAINKEAESLDNDVVDIDLEEAIAKGVEKQISEIYEKLPSKRREQADKAIAALDRIQKKLRSKAYSDVTGIVAFIDAGLTTTKAAIKAGVSVADAIELGITKIKELYGKPWAKEAQFRKDMLDGFKEEQIDVKEGSKVKVKTEEQKLADAKKRVRERIAEVQQEIVDKKKELTTRTVLTDPELQQLQALEASLKKEASKYLTDASKALLEARIKSTIIKRLEGEIVDIDKQIADGEKKTREEKKDPYESPEINALKAEKKAKLEVLEMIDPSPSDFVKQALIDSGYGRDIKIKGETRTVLDWKKLAGEEGSIDRMRDNVQEVLKGKGYTEGEIARLQENFTEEYNSLRASIIEKSLKELQNRNTEKAPVDVKPSARRLAELYNYGLFDREADTYDYLMNNALGMGIKSQEIFFEAKRVAKALSDLYASKNNGKVMSNFALQPAVNSLNNQITQLLNKIALSESNWQFKVATVAKEYVGLAQRFLLVNLKNMTENIFSGYVERAFSKVTFLNEKTDTPALRNSRRELGRKLLKDISLNGGLDYGNTNSPFLSRSMTQDFLDTFVTAKSKDQALHAILTVTTGRAFLEGTDSMHKSVLTEKLFVRQLVKVLSNPSHPNRMSREDAVNYVSETLTGQTFKDAQDTAKKLIDDINTKTGKKVLPDNKESVYRLANSIVKDALLVGNKLSLLEVQASLGSAYKVAGFGMGHEANNIISKGAGLLNSSVENELKKAIKDKKWNTATALTFGSILTKNIINPFVGGGTNWVTLTLQKAGIDFISPTVDTIVKRENPIDVTTVEGIKNLENALTYDAKSKSTQGRVFIGAVAGILTLALVKGTGADDDLSKWLKKNEWLRKYFNVLSPQMLIFLLALKDKQLGKYMSNFLNVKNDQFNDSKKFVDGITKLTTGKTDKERKSGSGKLGDVIGSKLSAPLPYKFFGDIGNVVRGIRGMPQVKSEWNTSGFFNGFYRTGVIEFIGLRPEEEKAKPLTDREIEARANEAVKKAEEAMKTMDK